MSSLLAVIIPGRLSDPMTHSCWCVAQPKPSWVSHEGPLFATMDDWRAQLTVSTVYVSFFLFFSWHLGNVKTMHLKWGLVIQCNVTRQENRKEVLLHSAEAEPSRNIRLHERSQTQKAICCMTSFTWNVQRTQIWRQKVGWWLVAQAGGRRWGVTANGWVVSF